MSQRITITIPDEHYDWLEDVMKRRGWDSVQGAVRSLIEDTFRLDKKIGAAKVDEPVIMRMEGEMKEKSAVQTS